MTVSERLLKYVSFDTQSDEGSETCPSTEKQRVFGAALVEEMQAMGIRDAHMDEDGYVYGSVEGAKNAPVIGLIAHMDTSPDCSGKDIQPRIVEYTGGDIVLNAENGVVMRAADFPLLKNSVGKHLIVTDGTTLLGADDKAGIAEILTAVEELLREGTPHAGIRIGFTPAQVARPYCLLVGAVNLTATAIAMAAASFARALWLDAVVGDQAACSPVPALLIGLGLMLAVTIYNICVIHHLTRE